MELPPTEMWGGGGTVGSQQGIEKQEEIAPFDVQCQGREEEVINMWKTLREL